jgi:hypothetical protein
LFYERKDKKGKKCYNNFMEQNLLNLKRRHVLGNIYSQCENIENIPVYLDVKGEEPIGFADESLGRYIDAFSFHLPGDICKKLSSNGYVVAVDYQVSEENKRMYKINHFVLLAPTNAVIAPKKKVEVEKV